MLRRGVLSTFSSVGENKEMQLTAVVISSSSFSSTLHIMERSYYQSLFIHNKTNKSTLKILIPCAHHSRISFSEGDRQSGKDIGFNIHLGCTILDVHLMTRAGNLYKIHLPSNTERVQPAPIYWQHISKRHKFVKESVAERCRKLKVKVKSLVM